MSREFSYQKPLIIPPKKLFLLDSIGAFLSAVLLGVVLVRFENIFGMPRKVLYSLSTVAFIFSIYSCLCYLFIKANWQAYLKVIAVANLLYCVLTLSLLVNRYPELTKLGMIYFVLEICIIFSLAMVELKTAASRGSNMG